MGGSGGYGGKLDVLIDMLVRLVGFFSRLFLRESLLKVYWVVDSAYDNQITLHADGLPRMLSNNWLLLNVVNVIVPLVAIV